MDVPILVVDDKPANLLAMQAVLTARMLKAYQTGAANDVLKPYEPLAGGHRAAVTVELQPKVELATGRIVGVEALLRWQHPHGRVVGASEFMGLAEDSGFIVPVGEQVVGAVCRQPLAWHDAGLPVSIAVNLSARELRGDRLLRSVRESLEAAQLEPSTIEFEVTEHASIQNFETTPNKCASWRAWAATRSRANGSACRFRRACARHSSATARPARRIHTGFQQHEHTPGNPDGGRQPHQSVPAQGHAGPHRDRAGARRLGRGSAASGAAA